MKNSYALAAVFIIMLALSCASQADSLPPINTDAQGVAIKGYDPVAYFTLGVPTEGSAEFEHTWNGARWRFASAEHLEMFRGNPGKYAPQYGGY
jgi:YHS domain-containing protein